MAERGGALVLAQPTALAAAKLTKKLYMPTALVHERLPAGLGELGSVPQLQDSMAETPEARLQEYCSRIRETSKVFATYQHKNQTLKADESYVIWIDAWAQLSGFGQFIAASAPVSDRVEHAAAGEHALGEMSEVCVDRVTPCACRVLMVLDRSVRELLARRLSARGASMATRTCTVLIDQLATRRLTSSQLLTCALAAPGSS